MTRKRFTLKLTCGCRTHTRDLPRKNAYLTCDSGLRHGHHLRWSEAMDNKTEMVYTNNALPK